MNCPNCQHEVRPGAKFCEECGNKLQQSCPQCQEAITNPKAKFCFSCGFKLDAPAPSGMKEKPLMDVTQNPITDHVMRQAERRQLTVMFCDMVGSTALSENMDVEEFRQVILDYQRIVEDVIKGFGGSVGNYLGDGLLVYFGYPVALEDAPKMSIRCGLAILSAISEQNLKRDELNLPLIRVRMGIHTGMVVVDNHLALGDTTNIAARLEGLAEINTIVISPQTHALTTGWFKMKSKGIHQLKGIATPIEVFQVLEETEIRNKFELSGHMRMLPLTGRELELRQLSESWRITKSGRGQIAVLTGEAGIGKSRLIEEMRTIYNKEFDQKVINLYCSSHYQHSPYFPIKDFIERKFLLVNNKDTDADRYQKLVAFLELLELAEDDILDPLTDLFGIESVESKPSSGDYTQKVTLALNRVIVKLARQTPILLVCEDYQWIDPSTSDWLDSFVDLIGSHPIFFIAASRESFPDLWIKGRSNVLKIKLTHLEAEHIRIICRFLAKNKRVPKKILDQIILRTDGIPLFVEEVTRMLLQSDSLIEDEKEYRLVGSIDKLMIPSSLRDSLMVRLDNMVNYKPVIQLGSVIGREFSLDLLASISDESEQQLQAILEELVRLGFLFRKSESSDKRYVFKSAMVQEIAYQLLLKKERLRLHQRMVEAIESDFQYIVEDEPEILAHHLTEAGMLHRAVDCWYQSSQQAMQISAYQESFAHIEKAMMLYISLPVNKRKSKTELNLNLQFTSVLRILKGWSHPDVQQAYEICLDLAKKAGGSLELFITLFGIWTSYLVDGNLDMASKVGQDMLDMGLQMGDEDMKIYGASASGNVLYYMGKVKEAELITSQYNPIYDLSNKDRYLKTFGLDPMVLYFCYGIWFPMMLCDYKAAEKRLKEAEEFIQAHNNPFSTIVIKTSVALYHLLTGHIQLSFAEAEKVIAMTEDAGFIFYYAWAIHVKGWSMTEKGLLEEGLKLARRGKNVLAENGCKILTLPSCTISKILIKHGRAEEALDELDDGLKMAKQNGERVYEPELLRLRAVALHQLNYDSRIVWETFEMATDLAEQLVLPLLKLRTLNSMLEAAKGDSGKLESIAMRLQDHLQQYPGAKGFPEHKFATNQLSNFKKPSL